MPQATVLDDLEEVRRIDKSNMLSICTDAPRHFEEALKLARTCPISYPQPLNIIVAGMGGSAIGGELLRGWTADKVDIPIEICREYSLPKYANAKTLVFIVSYSGETEEALNVFLDATRRKCMTICISSGGSLSEFSEKLEVPCLHVPSGMPPRAALPYLYLPMVVFLEKIGLISKINAETSETVRILKKVRDENSPENPLARNLSKRLASYINGTVPVVYGFGIYSAIARRYKQQFNENSKVPSKWEFFPELNHNEIVGWEVARELAKCFSVIIIRDQNESDHMRKRIEITKNLISKTIRKPSEVWSFGESRLAKMFSTILVGDFASIYLAVLRGVDPTPVKTISFLKEKIKQAGAKERIIGELQSLVGKNA